MRLFAALDLPNEQKRLLSSLRRSIAGVVWYPPESYHLTLRFLGEVRGRPLLEEIDHALAGITAAPVSLELNGVGVFTQAGRSRLWAGLAPSDALTTLQAKVETALRRAGLAAEKRRFQPHVSLGTFQGDPGPDIIRWVQNHNLLRSSSVEIEHITLFHSHKTNDEPHYEACADYPLSALAHTPLRAS
ncbi:RNA 2',3'-cyclic phosphodiesterase [Asaia siamensis]|uniref:RNA 2',3'-cyclic phosphodiesterase n=1 Tax=Asaia siamensis TaxID=110479 RepID=A0ABQ1LJG5_9PROT|nr:RNA 2',3'-cyclic phosphodiesterase [Asaia siamensis]GBR08267.1 2'-5' RNA ligase [Asaia siamensis NRIC 0323]GGC23144.1 RNA 2',3'-cyclic phosphodiesterase [Asaia siamensis]